MSMDGQARRLARAVRGQAVDTAKQHDRGLEYGEVIHKKPLGVELLDHNLTLDSDDLMLSTAVKRDKPDKGDTVLLAPMPDGDWLVLGASRVEEPDGVLRGVEAGDGLVISGADNDHLDVGEGFGLDVTSNQVKVDDTVIATRSWVNDQIAAGGGGGPFLDVAGAGLTKTGSTVDLVAGDTTLSVAANNVTVNTGVIATRSYADGVVSGFAPLASPTFTGDPKAPTPTAGDSDTSIATTAFVTSAISTAGAGYAALASANAFTALNTFTRTTDAVVARIIRGTDTAPIQDLLQFRDAANVTNLARVTAIGQGRFNGLDLGNAVIANLGDAAGADHAVSRSFGDARYAPLASVGTRFLVEHWNPATLASTAVGVALTFWYAAVQVIAPATITGIEYQVGAASAGVLRVALYDSTGVRVGNLASNVTQGTANTRQQVAFAAPVAVTPGLYYAAIGFNNAAATFMGADTARPAGTTVGASIATPTSITPPTTNIVAPRMMLY